MTHFKILAGIFAALVWVSAVPAFAEDAQSTLADLRKAANIKVGEMTRTLRKELKTAIKEGGFVKAIEVCQTVAPSIAATLSEEGGMVLRRTALKVRNPGNAPDEYERKVLEKFVADFAAGKEIKKVQHAKTEEADGGRVFRFMRAIPTGKVCLNCHGDNIKDDVKAQLDKLYPEDQATGFKAGELRGAFSFSKKL